MEMGTVKWFNNAKGFGFICPEGGGEDIFAHYSTIQMDGYRTLKAGQSVRFDVHQGPKGNHASLIVPVEAEAVAYLLDSFCTPRRQNASPIGWHFYFQPILEPARPPDPVLPRYGRATSQTKYP